MMTQPRSISAWIPASAGMTKIIGIGLLLTSVSVGCILPRLAAQKTTVAKTIATAKQTTLSPEGFQLAVPGYRYQFPADYAAHPAFKTEWWYVTGHLQAPKSKQWYGYELTFFRLGQTPQAKRKPAAKQSPWAVDDIYMTHFALTDESAAAPLSGRQDQAFRHWVKFNRPAFGRAGSDTKALQVWNEGWQLKHKPDGTFALTASSDDVALTLNLAPKKPPAIHGVPGQGISQKAECYGCASHYVSLTRLNTTGTLTVNGQTQAVTGQSWFDQEFGSNQLTSEQTGWNWMSLQLDNGWEAMLYVLRQKDGGIDPNSSGSLIDPNGNVRHLKAGDFTMTPTAWWTSAKTSAKYPVAWQVSLKPVQANFTVKATVPQQELDSPGGKGVSYWEGRSVVSGRWGKSAVGGMGYVELTGYDKAFRQRL